MTPELSVAVGVALRGGERLRRATDVDAAGAVTPFSCSGTNAANSTSGVVARHMGCVQEADPGVRVGPVDRVLDRGLCRTRPP